jgi:two-component system, response regulator PdtaR
MGKKIKILLVEDEAIIAQYLSLELELEGHEVCGYVATGEEAIQKALSEKPDLILMDINLLGEMDGIQAAEKILEYNYIPIIFMTGYSKLEFTSRAQKLNPLGYFNKPIEVEILSPLIEKTFAYNV